MHAGEAQKPKSAIIGRIPHQQRAYPSQIRRPFQRIMDKKSSQSLTLVRRVHGNGPQKKRRSPPHAYRPEPDCPGKNARIITRHTAQPCHRVHPLAQPIRGQRLASGGKAQIIKRLDLPPVLRLLLRQLDHTLPPSISGLLCLWHRPSTRAKAGQCNQGARMFYRPEDGHGLPHNPFNAVITPRPIGWISTRDGSGHDNLAPYSFFNAVAYDPPQVMFASTAEKADQQGTKDSVANIRETGVFCVNIVEYSARHAMNASSAALGRHEDEFAHAGLEKATCETIACTRVAQAPAALECRLVQILQLPGKTNFAVFGQVTGVHLREDCLIDGRFDVTRYQPLARLGYRDYARITELFSLTRPND